MTLEQLRVFVAVAERQHVTRAAEALHIAQSAASAAVATLEARHGVRLFDRLGRGITLTEAGRLFLAEARAVLARAEAAERVLAELPAGDLAVRSSARNEDGFSESNAGKFQSELNVGFDAESLAAAIERVIASYDEGDDHQVLP